MTAPAPDKEAEFAADLESTSVCPSVLNNCTLGDLFRMKKESFLAGHSLGYQQGVDDAIAAYLNSPQDLEYEALCELRDTKEKKK